MTDAHTPARAPQLEPVGSRGLWIVWGLTLQAIGVGIPMVVALRRASRDGVLGHITHNAVGLLWHELLRSHADVALILGGVVVYVVGAVVLARPFLTRRSTLLIAVPVAAIAGVALLGAIAVVCAAVIALVESPDGASSLLDNVTWPFSGRGRRRR